MTDLSVPIYLLWDAFTELCNTGWNPRCLILAYWWLGKECELDWWGLPLSSAGSKPACEPQWVPTSGEAHGPVLPQYSSPAEGPSHFLIRLYSMLTGWWWMRYWSVITTDIIHVPGMCGPGCSASFSKKQWCSWQVVSLHFRSWSRFILSVCSWLQNRYLERRNEYAVSYTSWLFGSH